jgi:hypothetical protein
LGLAEGWLSFIDLEGKRSFAVGESFLWTKGRVLRVWFSAEVAAAVSLKATPKAFSKLAALVKDAAATRYANIMPPLHCELSPLGRVWQATQAHPQGRKSCGGRGGSNSHRRNSCDLEGGMHLAAEFEALGGSAKAANTGDPLRECWLACELSLLEARRGG